VLLQYINDIIGIDINIHNNEYDDDDGNLACTMVTVQSRKYDVYGIQGIIHEVDSKGVMMHIEKSVIFGKEKLGGHGTMTMDYD